MRIFAFLVLFSVARQAFAASEECAALVPDLVTTCPAFDYASDRVIDLEVERAEVTAQQDSGTEPSLSQALNRISTAEFDEACCELISNINASRCFCQADVMDALMSDTSDELLAFAIFSAARPLTDGCGGLIWASLDEGACLLLGPEPDDSARGDACRSLEDELRSPQQLQGNFALLEEVLDVTDVLDEVTALRQFVLFAPTDTGIQNFAEQQNMTIGELLSETDLLSDALRRHIITGNAIRQLSNRRAEVETLEGTTLTIRRNAGRFTVQGFPVIQEGVELCRGEVHVINGVLWPPSATNTEPLREETDAPDCQSIYEVLLDFEEAFGDLLEQISATPEIQELLQGTEAHTIFAVTSPADPDEGTVEDVERLIVEGDVSSDDLTDGASLLTLSGESLRVSVGNGVTRVNGIRIVQTDVLACNGRVHILAAPLPEAEAVPVSEPPTSSPVEIPPIVEIEAEIVESCACTSDGISNGIDTGRLGCAQHRLETGDASLFCYIQDSEDCESEDEIVESEGFPGAFWRICEREDALLPLLDDVIQSTDSLEHIFKYFAFSRLDTVLTDDRPITILVPEAAAFEGSSVDDLLEQGPEGAQQLRTFLRRHIIDGAFTSDELSAESDVTTLDGDVLAVQVDSDGAVVLNDSVSVTQTDTLASNGVIHVIDGLLQPPRQMGDDFVDDPCECVQEGDAETAPFARWGCKQHLPNRPAFCYVRDPMECLIGTASEASPGAEWRVCVDPCRCSETGVSGTVDTGRRGCARHSQGDAPFCYIAEPDLCDQGTPSTGFPGAAWKWCERPEMAGVVEETPPTDPCDCSEVPPLSSSVCMTSAVV